MVRAIEAGLDLMEHAEFLDPDGVMRYDPSIAEMMRDAGIYVSPTLQAAGYPTRAGAAGQARGRRADARPRRRAWPRSRRGSRTRVEHFGQMLEAGLLPRMVAGSDSGCGNLAFGHLDYDLRLMVTRRHDADAGAGVGHPRHRRGDRLRRPARHARRPASSPT